MNANPLKYAFSLFLMITGVFPASAQDDSLMEIPQINVEPFTSDMMIDVDVTDTVKETLQSEYISLREIYSL